MCLQSLDVFMAGDDVDKKKPDPSIYKIAAERLKVDPKECLVVEDSTIGLQVYITSFSAPADIAIIASQPPAHGVNSLQAQCLVRSAGLAQSR